MTTNEIFYYEMSKLRDLFHKHGRFDDSNSKLDEITKYIAIYIYQINRKINDRYNLKSLLKEYEENNSFRIVKELKHIFNHVAVSKEYMNNENVSIFGNQPTLNIEDEDNQFAYYLIDFVVKLLESLKGNDSDYSFDLMNESFGHFVRDNFRNHIEDAQYMTPPEVVDLMCKIGYSDLSYENKTKSSKELVICDPCCGVGSFLSSFYKYFHQKNISDVSKLRIIGQDKVSRMVRLSKINMMLFNNLNHSISIGNSLSGVSPIDEYKGNVDLILTNPPFGAKFSGRELASNPFENYPLLNDIIIRNDSNFDSEILFVDRCISLLRPTGKLLVVLPDSVISSAGMNAILRQRISREPSIVIKAIIELPAVTFAQAGTRTKTSILYLEKTKQKNESKDVFIAQSDEIGFEVSTRKGATIKIESGKNDLLDILEAYENKPKAIVKESYMVLNEKPSCVLIKPDVLSNSSWTPSHYNAKKYQAVSKLTSSDKKIELVKLSEIVKFETKSRKKEYIKENSSCISVLHILNDDNLNYEEMLTYRPKYPGIACHAGDLLFSKINPRILRVLVVPDFGLNLTCSSEFEIMNSKIEINNYGIKLLLMLPSVQTQIKYLTSGTSSSHNRIKTADLENVLIPIPKKNSETYKLFLKRIRDYELYNKQYIERKIKMIQLKREIFLMTT